MNMAKKKKNHNSNPAKSKEQIYVPKCCQQPRSHGSTKPRTDFSLFFSPSSSSTSPESKLELLRCNNNISSITTASEEMLKFELVQCVKSQNEGKRDIQVNSIQQPFTHDTWSPQKIAVDTCDNGNELQNKSEDDAATLLCTPNTCTSQVTTYSDVWTTPGSTIWAKTDSQMWWPAKVMGGRSTPVAKDGQIVDGHVLVQYYGNHELAWLDPAGDLSQFDECFEERSHNPMEAFQDALKQALNRKEQPSLCRQLDRSFAGVKSSTQRQQASGSQPNKSIESSSSRAEDDFLERRRGNRKRKPKVHFDEVTFPIKSAKKMRRFRIMRHLGLTAPIGSPFSLTSRVRTAYNSF